jgi:two-component system cell cycle response regulator
MGGAFQNRARILIAEDSPLCQKLVETALTNQPYEVRFAASGQEALTLFEADRPDILIADWMMPPPSGLELCREVRKQTGGYTYIILMTSKSEKENLIEGLDAGADDYVTKPFDAGELLARIRVGCRIIQMSRDIENRNTELEEAVRTDHLTGLPNRKAVEEFASKQLEAARRHGFPLWVVVADLDKFKLVNDTHGHSAGDDAIKRFADLLKANTRSADMSGRLGGDEFVLVISHGEKKAILQTIDRLRADFAGEPFNSNGPGIQVTASFGIAGFQASSDKTLADLLIRADKALYSAKSAGRNQVVAAVDRQFVLRN